MLNKTLIVLFCFLCFCFSIKAQNTKNKKKDTLIGVNKELKTSLDSTQVKKEIDPLTPSRAAFYSAVLPGLGQAYNKKYWKIPIVIGAITGGILVYDFNNKQYNRARDAYKRRLAGFQDDEFQGKFTDDGLIEAQKSFRRKKELSLLVTIGLYALNIIDANVDAHLLQYNIDEDLTLKPHYKIDAYDNTGSVGLTLNFKIN